MHVSVLLYDRVLKSLYVSVSGTAVDIDTDASMSVYLFPVLHVHQFSLFIYSAIPISVCPLHSCSLCGGWLFLVSVMFYYACVFHCIIKIYENAKDCS